jgi:hypothetical protein
MGDLDLKLREIQASVTLRFKSQRYSEWQEELKSLGSKEVKKKKHLLLDLKSLNFDPAQESAAAVVPLETLQARVLELHGELEDRKHDLILANDLEASMLLEVSRLSFLSFLKVFEMEVDLVVPNEDQDNGGGGGNAKEGKDDDQTDEATSLLREEISKLNEQVFLLRSGLKEKQSEITRYEQKEGVGLKVTLTDCLSVSCLLLLIVFRIPMFGSSGSKISSAKLVQLIVSPRS